jgi:hypothetical protein
MKNVLSKVILNSIAFILFVISLKTTFYNLKNIDCSDTVSGKVSNVKLEYSNGKSRKIYAYEFQIINNKKKFLTTFETLEYTLKNGDNVVIKNMYAGNTNAKILNINGKKIDNYFGFFDGFMFFTLIIIISIYIIYFNALRKQKYTNKKKEYDKIYNKLILRR